jgi:hypothetical protein
MDGIDPDRFLALAREAAMVALPLQPHLPSLTGPTAQAMVRAWAPRPGDWDRVFLPPAAGMAQAFYQPIWEAPLMEITVPADQTEIGAWAATPEMLHFDNPISREFPPSYRHVLPWMQPDRVWVAWRYSRPGSSAGTSLDGLVWVDDHWAWFPKPWRALAGQQPSSIAEA